MRRFNLNIPIDLYERIKVTAKKYGLSVTKMIIKLLEIGYIISEPLIYSRCQSILISKL